MQRVKTPAAVQSFACTDCGASYGRFLPQCRCGKWDTLRRSGAAVVGGPRRLDQGVVEHRRRKTEIPQLDFVLGGGFVLGSSVFLTGDPGAGKSTLALQAGFWTATYARRQCLYVGGEEHQNQVCARARRIGVNPAAFWFHGEVELASIERLLVQTRPSLLIVDSVQLLGGGLDQDCIKFFAEYKALLRLLSKVNVPGLLVSQVNRDGKVMGGNRVAHFCDAVLHLGCPGDPLTDARRVLSTPTKNRFNKLERAEMKMTAEGLV